MNAVATNQEFRVATTELKQRVRQEKLRALLGNSLSDFEDLFRKGDPSMSLGVFDDSDRIYLDMILAEAGLTVRTMDHQEPYALEPTGPQPVSLVRNIKEEIRALDQFDTGLERARAHISRYRQTIYQMFGTHLVDMYDPWNPAAVLCSTENQDFVQNCLSYYHGPLLHVDRFLNTPEGLVWVISPGVPRTTET